MLVTGIFMYNIIGLAASWIRVFLGLGKTPNARQNGKMHNKGHIWGKFSVNVVLHHVIFM